MNQTHYLTSLNLVSLPFWGGGVVLSDVMICYLFLIISCSVSVLSLFRLLFLCSSL